MNTSRSPRHFALRRSGSRAPLTHSPGPRGLPVNGIPRVFNACSWTSIATTSSWPRDNRNFRALLGHGLLTSKGGIWRRHRTRAQPVFHHQRLSGLVHTVSTATAEVSARWEQAAQSGQPINLGAETGRLAPWAPYPRPKWRFLAVFGLTLAAVCG